MVWRGERKGRFNSDWPRVRALILDRDKHRCQWPVEDDYGRVRLCGAYANQVDHKKRDSVHDDDSPENLWALCDRHHSYKTELEAAEQRRENRRRRAKAKWYGHPAFH